MTLVNTATGELVESITEADVDASIARVIDHAESIWDEWAWQVENQTWTLKGFASWDEMRVAVYGGLTAIQAPRQERPELVSRFRAAGLTQKETAATLGIGQATVARHDEPTYKPKPNIQMDIREDIVDAELVDDEPASVPVKARPADSPSADLSLINDIRLYLGALASSPQVARLTPVGRQHIIDALKSTINKLEGN